MQQIDFYFDYTCPYAYLASTQIEGVAERTGASLKWKPFLLGGVFRALDVPQVLFKTLSPAKAKHNFADMHRWAELWDVPLIMPSEHPRRSVEALRATLDLPEESRPRFIQAVYRAYWVEGRDIADRAVLRAILDENGYTEASVGPFPTPIKDVLRQITDEAIAKDVFGAPATVVGDELYWGQDRLWMIEESMGKKPFSPPLLNPGPPRKEVEFFFDVSSPFAFLAATQVDAIAKRNGAKVIWKPMFLGGIFKLLGGPTVPLQTFNAPKQRFIAKDLVRWADHWGIPFKWPSQFPMMTVKAMRILLSLGQDCGPLAQRIYQAYWCEDRSIQSLEVLEELVAEVGLPATVLEAASDPRWKKALIDATQNAVDRGVFGAPTFVVDGALIWGQDRLNFVERALQGWNADSMGFDED